MNVWLPLLVYPFSFKHVRARVYATLAHLCSLVAQTVSLVLSYTTKPTTGDAQWKCIAVMDHYSSFTLSFGICFQLFQLCMYNMHSRWHQQCYSLRRRPAEYSTGSYMHNIQAAFATSSQALLQLLQHELGLNNTLAALKHYFLLDKGDLLLTFLDTAEEELSKPASEVSVIRLQSLLDLGKPLALCCKYQPNS